MMAMDIDAPVRVPLRAVIASIAGLWLCYFVLNSIRSAIGLEMQGELLWRRGLVCLAGVAITLMVWLVLQLFDRRRLWLQIVAALILAMPAAILIVLANERVFADVQERVNTKVAERQGYALRRDQAGNLVIEGPAADATEGADPLGSDGPRAQLVLPNEDRAGTRMVALLDLALGRYFLFLAWAAL